MIELNENATIASTPFLKDGGKPITIFENIVISTGICNHHQATFYEWKN